MPADLSVSANAPSFTSVREEWLSPHRDHSSAAPGGTTTPPRPNPTFQLDPALNIVVLQVHDQTGDVVSSFPTEQQLNAYRSGERKIPEMLGTRATPAGHLPTDIQPASQIPPTRQIA